MRGKQLKGLLKLPKKRSKNHHAKDEKQFEPARRSGRIKLKEKNSDYVDQNVEKNGKKSSSVSDLMINVEAIDMNPDKKANADKNDSRYQCEDCSARFVFKNSLQRHTNSQHKDNCFQCSICGEHFVRSDSLKRHSDKIHSMGSHVQYLCNLCSKTFDYKQNLVRHIKKYHNSEE